MHTMGKFSAYGCEVLLTGHSNMPNISFTIHNISWMEYDHINRTGTVYFHEQLIDELTGTVYFHEQLIDELY